MSKNKPISLLACLMALALAFLGSTTQAAEAPPPVVLETFACNYHDGKDMDDLLAARDYMVKQAKVSCNKRWQSADADLLL